MSEKPVISVIIPVYNGERFLGEAIESVLTQTYRPIKVIVVDDGSSDRSGEVAQGFRPLVQYHLQPNGGTATARNRGVNLARGRFIAFLDADDLWVPEKLVLQMQVFDKHPEVEAVFGHVKEFYSPELDSGMREKIRCSDQWIPGYLPCTMLIKREAFFRVGMFETQWRVGSEMSWILRARDQDVRMIMLPDLVYLRRLHARNKGITQRLLADQRIHVIKASLDRRRKMVESRDDES